MKQNKEELMEMEEQFEEKLEENVKTMKQKEPNFNTFVKKKNESITEEFIEDVNKKIKENKVTINRTNNKIEQMKKEN